MAVVMTADLAVVTDLAGKIRFNQFLDVSAASPYYFDALGFEDIFCSLAHIAGKHDGNTHLLEYRGDSAFAAASFGRSKSAHSGHFSVRNIKYSIIGAMSEMVIHPAVSCRYRYLHNIQ